MEVERSHSLHAGAMAGKPSTNHIVGFVVLALLLGLPGILSAADVKVTLYREADDSKTILTTDLDKSLAVSFTVPDISDNVYAGVCQKPLLLAVVIAKDSEGICPQLSAVTWFNGSSETTLTRNDSTANRSYTNDPPAPPGQHIHAAMWWMTKDKTGGPTLTSGAGQVRFKYASLAHDTLVAGGVYLTCGVDQQAPFDRATLGHPERRHRIYGSVNRTGHHRAP